MNIEESVQQHNSRSLLNPTPLLILPPSTRGLSETPRNPVAVLRPVVTTRYQQVSSGERISTGLNGAHQPVSESSRQFLTQTILLILSAVFGFDLL